MKAVPVLAALAAFPPPNLHRIADERKRPCGCGLLHLERTGTNGVQSAIRVVASEAHRRQWCVVYLDSRPCWKSWRELPP